MAKARRKPQADTYRDADGIERDARTRRRVIRVGARPDTATNREAKPKLRPSVVDLMESRGMWSPDRDRNRALAECARVLARRWFDAGLAHAPKSPNLLSTGAGTGDPAYMLPTQEHAARARDEVRMARAMIGPRCWPAVEAVVCEDRTVATVKELTDYKAAPQAVAVVIERVIHGIEIMALEWGHLRA